MQSPDRLLFFAGVEELFFLFLRKTFISSVGNLIEYGVYFMLGNVRCSWRFFYVSTLPVRHLHPRARRKQSFYPGKDGCDPAAPIYTGLKLLDVDKTN